MWGGLPSIRPEERRGVVAAFLTLFGILAAHTVLETARDALFLARLPAAQLPWVYLAIAAISVLLTQLPARGHRARGHDLGPPLALFAVTTLVLWLFGSWSNPWMLRLLYVWTGVVGTMATLQFWVAMGEIYTITQAKRLFRVIGMGSLAGAACGGALAGLLSMRAGASWLLPASAVLMGLTA